MKYRFRTNALTAALSASLVLLSGYANAQEVTEQEALPKLASPDESAAVAKGQDFSATLRELTPLANQGNATAQYNLGRMYGAGQGVPRDYIESVKWHRLAAIQGNAAAQYGLGVMYATGRGVPQDFKEVLNWFRLSAEQGYVLAQSSLGIMYGTGHGVSQDYKESVRWSRRAADQGDANAQTYLGLIYACGQGVTANLVVAYALYNLSAANDPASTLSTFAADNRASLVKKLSDKEIQAAQDLTRELSKSKNLLVALDGYLK